MEFCCYNVILIMSFFLLPQGHYAFWLILQIFNKNLAFLFFEEKKTREIQIKLIVSDISNVNCRATRT